MIEPLRKSQRLVINWSTIFSPIDNLTIKVLIIKIYRCVQNLITATH